MKNHVLKLPDSLKKRSGKGFLSPSILIKEIDIFSGQNILEIGRPIGFFAPAILEALSGDGKLFVGAPARESFEKMHHLFSHYNNLEQILLSEILVGKLEDNSIDTVIFTNLFSNTKYIHNFCESLGQIVKPNSELIVFDWDPKHPSVGVDPESKHYKHELVNLLGKYGLSLSRELNVPGYHFGLVFRFG